MCALLRSRREPCVQAHEEIHAGGLLRILFRSRQSWEGELPEEAARTPRLTQRWEETCPKTPVCNSVVGVYTHGGRSEWERDK